MNQEQELFVKLHNYVRGWLEGRQYYVGVKALDFARQRHTHTRKDGITPEFSHQLHIARFFINIARLLPNTERVITLVFLDDVVEDGYATIDDIQRLFGLDISAGVRLLSKISGSTKIAPELYYQLMLVDADVCVVKGGDRLHNLESMTGVFTAS